MSTELPAHARKLSLGRTIVAVLWSFIGLRSRQQFNRDVAELNPVYLIVVGLVLALCFVLGLVALVNWVVAQPIAL
jgi:hypothetical protein